jgi:hypothetical protein
MHIARPRAAATERVIGVRPKQRILKWYGHLPGRAAMMGEGWWGR